MKTHDKFFSALIAIFYFFSLQLSAQSAYVAVVSDDCAPGNGDCFYGAEPEVTNHKY